MFGTAPLSSNQQAFLHSTGPARGMPSMGRSFAVARVPTQNMSQPIRMGGGMSPGMTSPLKMPLRPLLPNPSRVMGAPPLGMRGIGMRAGSLETPTGVPRGY